MPTKVHIVMWELDHKEDWTPKNWCFQIVVLEKTLESPLDSKETKAVNPQRNQPWIFIGRSDAEALIIWPAIMKSQLIGKDPGSGKDWGEEEKGSTEDEMVGWHLQLDGHEFQQTLGDSEGKGSLVWCSSWGCKELDMTEQLKWTETLQTMNFQNIEFLRHIFIRGKIPVHWVDSLFMILVFIISKAFQLITKLL